MYALRPLLSDDAQDVADLACMCNYLHRGCRNNRILSDVTMELCSKKHIAGAVVEMHRAENDWITVGFAMWSVMKGHRDVIRFCAHPEYEHEEVVAMLIDRLAKMPQEVSVEIDAASPWAKQFYGSDCFTVVYPGQHTVEFSKPRSRVR